jgi:hypothetical protein
VLKDNEIIEDEMLQDIEQRSNKTHLNKVILGKDQMKNVDF